jgi:hypothetical protein
MGIELWADGAVSVSIDGHQQGDSFVASGVRFQDDQHTAALRLVDPVKVPLRCLAGTAPTYRLKRLDEVTDVAAQAELRDVLHVLAQVEVRAAGAFFGADASLVARATLVLQTNLLAAFDGTDGAAAIAGALRVRAAIVLDAQAVTIGGGTLNAQRITVDWQLSVYFGGAAEFHVDVAMPELGWALPRVPLPNLTLPQLRWPAGSLPTWRAPEWLEHLPVRLTATSLAASFTTQGLTVTVEGLSLEWQDVGRLLHTNRLTLTQAGATVDRITFVTLQARFEFEKLLGLPIAASGTISATPVLVGGALEVQCGLTNVVLTESTGTSITLDASFTVGRGGLTSIEVEVKDAHASVELLIGVSRGVRALGRAVATLVEWTIALGAALTEAGKRLLQSLVEFLRKVVFPKPRLPSVGPVRNVLDGVLGHLADLAGSLCIQLVFDQSSKRLLRSLVSLRDRPDADPLGVRLGNSLLQIAIEVPARSRLAVLFEHRGPHAGDWFLLAVPGTQAADWFKLTVASDLWFNSGDNTALAQDTDAQGAVGTKPLLTATVKSRRNFAIAVAGVKQGRPVWLQAFATEPGQDLIELGGTANAPTLRLTAAGGAYRLFPVNASLFDVDVDLQKDRLLPFLKQRDSASAVSQYVRIKGSRFDAAASTLNVTLGFGLANSELATGTLRGRWSLHDWRLTCESATFHIAQQKKTFTFLGLTFELTSKPDPQQRFPAFELSFAGEPALRLHPDATLTCRVSALSSDPRQALRFEVGRGSFMLTRAGASLDAKLVNREPIELGGIKTRFTFDQAMLRIRDGRIQDCTIGARGTLPDWIGDADVQAAFRFGWDKTTNDFQLLGAWAELESPGRKIEAKALRFEFALKKIELAFKRDEHHNAFYFLLSGSAEFKPNGGEFDGGLLQYLKNARIELDRAPITSDPGTLLASLAFTVPLPKPQSINLFNLFKFEIRSVGFVCNRFGTGQHAIQLGGQCKFAEAGDVVSAEIDFHAMYIGPPAGSDPRPRIEFEGLRVVLKAAQNVRIGGRLIAVDRNLPLRTVLPDLDPGLQARGFVGDGELEIEGLVPLSASFGFLEIDDVDDPGTRRLSWYVYIQANKLSYQITAPIPLFIREIGLGFGYRYTLAGIAKTDEATTPAELIKALDEVARRQGDLARYSAWTPQPRGPARCTLAMRALLTMASAAPPQSHRWLEAKERQLPSLFTMDVVAALRSDFTFLMTLRLWLAVNYHDFYNGTDALRTRPLLTGFMYLSGPRREFMARLASSPNPMIGNHPVIPDLVQRALTRLRYSATLYMRPGLLHFEMGWPDQLRWDDSFGPLSVSCAGGFVFRVEDGEVLLGMNFSARGRLRLEARAGSDSFGASIAALTDVAFANRIIAVIDGKRLQGSMYYGLVAIDLRVEFAVSAWLRFRVFGRTIGFSVRFSFALQVSVALELVLTGEPDIAGRARCRVGIRAFGRTLSLQVDLAHNGGKVDRARARVARYLNLGLSGPSEPLPDPFARSAATQLPAPADASAALPTADAVAVAGSEEAIVPAPPSAGAAAAAPAQAHASPFGVFVRRLRGTLAGVSGDFVVVGLVPHGDHRGFFCTPAWNADGFAVRDIDYALANLPAGSWVVDRGGARAVGAGGTAQTSVNWLRRLDAADDATLALVIDNCFVDTALHTQPGNPPSYADPARRIVDPSTARVDGIAAEARGQALYAADRAGADEPEPDRAANDARELLLAQLLDSLVQFADRPNTTALCADLGLLVLVPRAAVTVDALQRITVVKADLPGQPCAVVCGADAVELDVFERHPVRIEGVEARALEDRIEFAWDLAWDDADADRGEPEARLYAWDVRIEASGDDSMGRSLRVRTADNLLYRDGRWQRQRATRQFTDDFADVGGADAMRGRTLRYAITPVAQDGSRGAVCRIEVAFDRIRVLEAPVEADLRIVLDVSKPVARLHALEVAVTHRLRDWNGPGSVAWVQPDAVQVLLRPEPIGIGGMYAGGGDQQARERSGGAIEVQVEDWISAALPVVLAVQPAADDDVVTTTLKFGAGDLAALAARFEAGKGLRAWRIYVRSCTTGMSSGFVSGALHLAPLDAADEDGLRSFVAVPAFELPYRAEQQVVRVVHGVAGWIRRAALPRPDDDATRVAPAGAADSEVGTELSWPAVMCNDPVPVAGYRLYELPLDALPPRLLDASGGPGIDAQRFVSERASLRLCARELLRLHPAENRDTEQWSGTYVQADCGTALVEWPAVDSDKLLPRVERLLLNALRAAGTQGDRSAWPARIGIRARDAGGATLPTAAITSESTAWTRIADVGGFAVFRLHDRYASEAILAGTLRSLRVLDPSPARTWPFDVDVMPIADDDRFVADAMYTQDGSALHPDLVHVAESLAYANEVVEYQAGFDDEAAIRTVRDLMERTPDGVDPLGFGILHRLGAATTFRIWDRDAGRYVPPRDLSLRLEQLPAAELPAQLVADFMAQPNRQWRLSAFDPRVAQEDMDAAFDLDGDGLAMLQLSLRPRPAAAGRGFEAWASRRGWMIPVDADWNDQRDAWLRRFARHGVGDIQADRTPAMVIAKSDQPGSYVAADAHGRIRWMIASSDPFARVTAWAVCVDGRYDDVLRRLRGQVPAPVAPSDAAHWHPVRCDRTKPVDPPAVVYAGHRMLTVGDHRVPVWEIAIGRHAEQGLSDANEVLACRLQYRGLLAHLERSPRDPEWLRRLRAETGLDYAQVPQLALSADAHAHPDFEQAWREETFAPREDFYPELWQGMELWRYPALPYFYAHTLHLSACAERVASAKARVEQSLPDLAVKVPQATASVVLGAHGVPIVTFEPTRYEQLVDPVTNAIAREPAGGNERFVRHAPDPDVQYELGFADGSVHEPVAHIRRNAVPTAPRSFRAEPLTRRLAADVAVVPKEGSKVVLAHVTLMPRTVVLSDADRPPNALPDRVHQDLDTATQRGPVTATGPIDEQLLRAIACAFVRNPATALDDVAAIETPRWRDALAAFEFEGVVETPPVDALMLHLHLNTFTIIRAGFERDRFDAWLHAWLVQSVWRSHAIRHVLRPHVYAFLADAGMGATTSIELIGTNHAVGPALPPGLSVVSRARPRWRYVGALDAAALAALRMFVPQGAIDELRAEALERILCAKAAEKLVLRRWRANPTEELAS